MLTPNESVARKLDEIALLLETGGASALRVSAYRRGADLLRELEQPVADVVARGGTRALDGLPGIGPALARAIAELERTGHSLLLERLRRELPPVDLLRSVPGIGRTLARRLVDELGISTLEALEAAAHDGRLSDVLGLADKTVTGIADSLAVRLARVRPSLSVERTEEPPVEELLSVDREYRESARRGELPTIAPRRFNPSGARWLPVLHTRRSGRAYTALFSNTALAHRLGTTRDWVVIYGQVSESGAGGRWTVVTERSGRLAGRRVVRGREREMELALEATAASAPRGRT